jgi:hypothetical protein
MTASPLDEVFRLVGRRTRVSILSMMDDERFRQTSSAAEAGADLIHAARHENDATDSSVEPVHRPVASAAHPHQINPLDSASFQRCDRFRNVSSTINQKRRDTAVGIHGAGPDDPVSLYANATVLADADLAGATSEKDDTNPS